MIVKLLVEEKGIYVNLIDILQAPATDDELEKIKKQSLTPIYYEDTILGEFQYDTQFEWFSKKVKWDNEKGDVYIYHAEPTVLKKQFDYVVTLLNSTSLEEVKHFASAKLAHLTKEWGNAPLCVTELLLKINLRSS